MMCTKNMDTYWAKRLEHFGKYVRDYLTCHPRKDGRYRITCRAYEEDALRYLDPVEVTVELTDDETVSLLARMLAVEYNYTFNALLHEDPKLACKINFQALVQMEEHEAQDLCPFLIELTEFQEISSAVPLPDDDDLLV